MAVIKVMFSAMLTAMLGTGLLMATGWIPAGNLHFMETVYGAHVVGGLLFGVGFVMSGWCPGTAAVGLASGKWDALVFLVGSLVGAVAFNESFAWIKPLYNWGLQSEPQFAFGIPTHLFAFGFAIVGVAAFYFSEWMETAGRRRGTVFAQPIPESLQRGSGRACREPVRLPGGAQHDTCRCSTSFFRCSVVQRSTPVPR